MYITIHSKNAYMYIYIILLIKYKTLYIYFRWLGFLKFLYKKYGIKTSVIIYTPLVYNPAP